jgi:metal-responsive CopG/Arc/MetJ family transcriptional regulator
MGRPPVGEAPASVYSMRLPDELIEAVDAYAEREIIKTRSEAVRRLVEQALAAAPAPKRPARGKST